MSYFVNPIQTSEGKNSSCFNVKTGEAERQEIQYCAGRNLTSEPLKFRLPPPGWRYRRPGLRGGSDVDSDDFSRHSHLSFTSSSSEEVDVETMEPGPSSAVDDDANEVIVPIDIACAEEAIIDVEAQKEVEVMSYDDLKPDSLFNLVSFATESIVDLELITTPGKERNFRVDISPEITQKAIEILADYNENGLMNVDIWEAIAVKLELDRAYYTALAKEASREAKNLESRYNFNRDEQPPEQCASRYKIVRGDMRDYAQRADNYGIVIASAKKNMDSMKSSSVTDIVKDRVTLNMGNENIKQIYLDHSRNKLLPDSLRNSFVFSSNYDKVVKEFEQLDPCVKEKVDQSVLFKYIVDTKDFGDLKTTINKACASDILNVCKYDPVLTKYVVTVDKDFNFKVDLKSKRTPDLFDERIETERERGRVVKVNFTSPEYTTKVVSALRSKVLEMESARNTAKAAKAERRDKIRLDESKVPTYNIKPSETTMAYIKALPKDAVEKTNKHQLAKDYGVTIEKDTIVTKPVSKTRTLDIKSKGVKDVIDYSKRIQEREEAAQQPVVNKESLRAQSKQNAKIVQEELDKLNVNKNSKEYAIKKSQIYEKVKEDNLRRAIAKINDGNKEKNEKSAKRAQYLARSSRYKGSADITADSFKTKALPVSKVGDHSVHVNGVIALVLDATLAASGQNAFAVTRARLYDARERVSWDIHTFSWQLLTRINTPYTNMEVRDHMYSHAWERFIGAGDEPYTTRIVLSKNIIKDIMDTTAASEYIRDVGIASVKPIADALQATLRMSKQVAEICAPTFTDNLVRYDNSAFFCEMFLLAMAYHDCEMAGIRPVVNDTSGARIDHISVTVGVADARATSQAFDLANSRGSFVFEMKHLSQTKLAILALMASGFRSLTLPNQGVRHIFSTFEMDTPTFLILHEGAVNREYFTADITAATILNFAAEIAIMFGMTSDYVEGATHALRIGNGMVANGDNRGVYYTCTLEARTVSLPRPHCHNCLWRLVLKEPRERTNPLLDREFKEIASMDPHEFQLTASLIARYWSTAIATNFHSRNITGREINSVHAQNMDVRHAREYLINYIQVRRGYDRAVIFVESISTMSQIFGVNLNSDALRQVSWCNGMNHALRPFNDDEMWERTWPRRVPYLFDPIIMLPYVVGMPEEWGYSYPRVSLDLSMEATCYSFLTLQAWWARSGDARYDGVVRSGNANRYVPYGAFVINTLLQHTPFRLERGFVISFELRTMVGTEIHTHDRNSLGYQPVFDRHIPHLFPGSLLTFDWATGMQLVPYINRESLPMGVYEIIASVRTMESMYAGVLSEGAPEHRPPINLLDVESMFEGMSIFSDGTSNVNETAQSPEN